MSELKKTRDVATCHKLPPPKSLRGEEDAEVTWDLILKRYPNAAPLLCQMETVIDKAEGLLQQLRSPYTHVLGRSSSFQIADSEDELMGPCHVEESTEVSMASEEDSRLGSVENMTPEIVSVAGCSISDKTISDDFNQENKSSKEVCSTESGAGISAVSKPEDLITEEACSPEASASSIGESISKSVDPESEMKTKEKSSIGVKESLKSSASSFVNAAESPTPSKKFEDQEIGKTSSLEAWGKVVGEDVNEAMKNLKNLIESKQNPSSGGANNHDAAEDSVSEHARRLTSLKNGPMQQIIKLNSLGKREDLVQRFAGTIATASKVVDTTNSRMVEKIEGSAQETVAADDKRVSTDARNIESMEKIDANELGERAEDASGNIIKNIEETNCTVKIETGTESIKSNQGRPDRSAVQGNGDEAAATTGVGPRSPVEILDEYSKICAIPVEYKNLSSNCSYNKNAVVKCCFGGFAFDACAQAKKIAKKDAAAKVLRCLVGRQIDGENITDLPPLTRQQMEEIIALGNGGDHETAVRKLYKICMELNAPEPIYTVHQDTGIVGNRYTVKCGALGITTSGYGIRVLVAKRVAADKLLQNYHENRSAVH